MRRASVRREVGVRSHDLAHRGGGGRRLPIGDRPRADLVVEIADDGCGPRRTPTGLRVGVSTGLGDDGCRPSDGEDGAADPPEPEHATRTMDITSAIAAAFMGIAA